MVFSQDGSFWTEFVMDDCNVHNISRTAQFEYCMFTFSIAWIRKDDRQMRKFIYGDEDKRNETINVSDFFNKLNSRKEN